MIFKGNLKPLHFDNYVENTNVTLINSISLPSNFICSLTKYNKTAFVRDDGLYKFLKTHLPEVNVIQKDERYMNNLEPTRIAE